MLPSIKVIVEKMNGDKIAGFFVAGEPYSITIEIAGKCQIPLSEISSLRFDVPAAPVKNDPPPAAENVLSVEAAIVYNSCQVMPVSRATFLLLDDDPVTICKNAGVQSTAMTAR